MLEQNLSGPRSANRRSFRRMSALLSVTALAALMMATGTQAQEFTPYIEGELLLELENDNTFSATDPAAEFNSLYPTVELAAIIGLTPIFGANLGLTLEQVLEQDSDNYFRDIGLYVDTLNAQADLLGGTIVAGKFAPTFGKAWDETPGLFATDLNEDYEISEMMGFGVAYPINAGDSGTHTLAANVFFVDTTVLSESAFTNRGRVRTSDGGAANTGKLDNFTVTLDGAEIAAVPGLSYNLGFAYLSENSGIDATGYVAGLLYGTELDNGWAVGVNGEIAFFNDVEGTHDDQTYYTAGLSFERESWHGEVAGSIRQTDLAAGGSETTSLLQLSGGYVFANDVDLTVGYAFVDEAGSKSHTVGVLLSKAFSFATAGAPGDEIDLPERPRTRQASPAVVR